jgi:hypothetical protein
VGEDGALCDGALSDGALSDGALSMQFPETNKGKRWEKVLSRNKKSSRSINTESMFDERTLLAAPFERTGHIAARTMNTAKIPFNINRKE